jgi:hypothetical protein
MRGDSTLRIAVRVLSVLLGSLFVLAVVPADYRWPVAGIGALALLVTAGLVTGLAGRPRLLAAKVSRLRPGATVIAGITTIETRGDARVSGAVDRRWDELGGSPVVLAALPDRIEVWAPGEDRPRWAITRRPDFPPVAVLASMPTGGIAQVQSTPALLITDGVSRVTVIPVYSGFNASAPHRAQAGVQRALGELVGA